LDRPVEFLPFNDMAGAKYPSLGMVYNGYKNNT